MAREKTDFRDNLERITERFRTELIPLKEAAAYLGCDPRTLRDAEDSPVKKVGRMYYVPAVALARWLS